MAQRPRISQLKRNDVNYRTFKEQFEELEENTSHFRTPVRTRGELPYDGNVDGSQCLVIEEGVVYYWDTNIQNWQPILGQVFKLDKTTFKRWKRAFVAKAGQTEFILDVNYETGLHEIDVYLQGMLQDVNLDYVEVDNHTIRFLEPLPDGAVVTIATPMIVESTSELNTYIKRLADLEYNSYQLMLNQYYDGKGFEAMGMVYDGFIDTSQIDYSLTSNNVLYDTVRKSVYLRHSTNASIVEQFDSIANFHPESTVYCRGSEITLPIATPYVSAFFDDFATEDFIDKTLSNIFWDRDKQLVTNDDTYGGGNHYYKGDFMNGTGNTDLVGFTESINKLLYSYYSDGSSGSTRNLAANATCYGVLAMGSMNVVLNGFAFIYRSQWPYSSYSHLYSTTSQYYHSDGSYYNTSISSNYRYNQSYSVWPVNNGYARPTVTYVAAWNKIVALYQYGESSGRYYQRLMSSDGKSAKLTWSWHNRPTGLPSTLFGSATNTYTQSSTYISQTGSTYDRLLIRTGDILYFLDSNYAVVKTLDWSTATRKPSTYNVISQQITADKRYLYFPARLLRDGHWGYYLEVFNIEDGSFVNEILVTRYNSGNPGTTAMSFDHTYNRLILGQQGNMRYDLYGKSKNSISEQASYAGMLIFEQPDERMREVISKPITTNLPQVYYRLNTTHTLNGGIIDYYIRFNDEAWTKINRGTNYTWTNPNGAAETIIQLRAVLKTTLTASKAPELTAWDLTVRPYVVEANYRSLPQLLSLDGVTGGSLSPSQEVPNQTSISWTVELDVTNNKYPATQDGIFAIPEMTGDGYFIMDAKLATNNLFMSPVVKDVKLVLYRDDEGILYTETSTQLFDISESNIWVTSTAGNSNFDVDVSRDGGNTWEEATARNSVQLTNGNVETNYYIDFKEDVVIKREFKIRFRINGSTEILQYGAKIN